MYIYLEENIKESYMVSIIVQKIDNSELSALLS